MKHRTLAVWCVLWFSLLSKPGGALAHITPPVVLLSERDAILGMLGGASKFFVREVKLTPEEQGVIQQQWAWRPEAEIYRFYLGRDATGQLVAATIFLTEYTIHGPVRVAVGLSPDGKVKDARVVELTEETFPWVKPLLDLDFMRAYVGQNSRADFSLSERVLRVHLQSMPQFYGQIVASLIQRAAILYEITFLQRALAK
jgi:hypothetical protein